MFCSCKRYSSSVETYIFTDSEDKRIKDFDCHVRVESSEMHNDMEF